MFPAVKEKCAEWQQESRDVSDAFTLKVLNMLPEGGQCTGYYHLLGNLGGEWSCPLPQREKEPPDKENRAALLAFSWEKESFFPWKHQ